MVIPELHATAANGIPLANKPQEWSYPSSQSLIIMWSVEELLFCKTNKLQVEGVCMNTHLSVGELLASV